MKRILRTLGVMNKNKLGSWKRFNNLVTTARDLIAFHGDNRPPSMILQAGGLHRYISSTTSSKPTIMDGGGTKNTVTTTTQVDVAANYATRGGSAHPTAVTGGGWPRYIYAVFIRAGDGIYLPDALPEDDIALPGVITTANINTHEVLTLDVPIAQVIGWRGVAQSRNVGGLSCEAGSFLANHLFNRTLFPGTADGAALQQLHILKTASPLPVAQTV
ncbi:hypothetical protein J8F10_35510 [Gemmata sp. G18]|uniref:DUF1559 domain-containing protein n=1 Tax=Gemmata palustris TaxID=2822762 RepID=A0ABS5C3J2_9BACT|nr:hypothetical protein [Gemmata palustris]MBP3960563.1 hypothetical protein [Gemmata palustris]